MSLSDKLKLHSSLCFSELFALFNLTIALSEHYTMVSCAKGCAGVVFSSLTFLTVFLPLFLSVYFMRRGIGWRNGVLLGASLIFYGWSDPIWILAMLFTTLVNYLCAMRIARIKGRKRKRGYLICGVAVSLGFLFYFKYASFAYNALRAVLALPKAGLGIRLPIGISFYTFQALSYTVDVYRGRVKAQKSFASLLLYVSCFPQLIAGPIVQYADVAEQLAKRGTGVRDFALGMRRFAVGLGKKVLLANVCGRILEETALAGGGSPMSVVGAWFSAFMFAMQLYFDFSAYSDMAIGIGRALGFTYKENFDYPYISASAGEFWRRWHISLGSFFREYVYIPLGGNRRGAWRTCLNLMIVWGLTGLWHGASWNFLVWGLFYGVLLIIERFALKGILKRVPRPIAAIVTFAVTLVGWVIFYYTDLSLVKEHILAMFGWAQSGGGLARAALTDGKLLLALKRYTVYPLIAFICSMPVAPRFKAFLARRRLERRWEKASVALLTALVALCVIFLIGQSYNPFIYFRF